MNYFVISLVNYDENNIPCAAGEICCKAEKKMNKEEIARFCREDLELDFEGVFSITEISYDEALEYEEEDKIPLFEFAEHTKQSLADKIAYAEQKKEVENETKMFDVVITETLKMTVQVEAGSLEEAEQLVSDNWHEGEYILDADNFIGVEFETKEVIEQSMNIDREER